MVPVTYGKNRVGVKRMVRLDFTERVVGFVPGELNVLPGQVEVSLS